MILPFLVFLLLPQDSDPGRPPCDVRVYVLDKNGKPASLHSVSALFVSEDRGGLEKPIPMTVVTTENGRAKAPACRLRSRRVVGTGLTAAVCTLGGDGRLRDPEAGGPRTGRPLPSAQEDDPAEDADVDFSVPYFQVRVPADHLCGPGCRASVRLSIAGNFHSTRSFPCPASWIQGAPTCCLHHRLVAECSELRRHLFRENAPAARASLDRIGSILLQTTPPEFQRDALILAAWAGSALNDEDLRRGASAAQELKTHCASGLEACGESSP